MLTLEALPKSAKIYVAGHTGLVGSSVVRALQTEGYENIVAERSSKLDLTRQEEVEKYFESQSPDYVFLCAAYVGGILANSTKPADFITQNLLIETNIIQQAHLNGVKRLIFLGSSCIYPKFCAQPISEESLLTGSLEPTNQAYAVAKICGIELCRSYNVQHGTKFLSVMPCNLYGPNDNFDLQSSHVLPALIRKICEAKDEVVIWGTGKPRREFLYSDDLADCLLFLMQLPDVEFCQYPLLNIGTGEDLTILELAHLIADVAGFKGRFTHDLSKPDGTFQKVLDVSKLRQLGWKPKISLREGIERMVYAYRMSSNR